MDTTATAEREVRSLPALDLEAIAAAQAKTVEAALSAHTDPEDRARVASEQIKKLTGRLEAARVKRDAAAWTLIQTHRIRRGADIPAALGVNRNRWKAIRDRQARLNPELVEDPLTALPVHANTAAVLAARVGVFTDARDAAVGELMAADWSNAQIARLIGRDPSRVSHIRNKEGAAA